MSASGLNLAAPSVPRLRIALWVILALIAAEVITGVVSGSLALLGDAGHLLTDVATLALAWYGVARARRHATAGHTFGFHRTGTLVAVLNGALLILVAALIAVAAVLRLQNPVAISALPVIVVAAVAVVIDTGLALVLRDAGAELSIRSAALHVIADAFTAAGVVVSGTVILATGWRFADPITSLVIAALIALAGIGVVREAAHILAEATPRDLDADAVSDAIVQTPGIEGVHDLHIWSLDRRHRALSAHVAVADQPLADITLLLQRLETSLCERFGIEHATLQPECPSCVDDAALYCDIDTRHTLVHAGAAHEQP